MYICFLSDNYSVGPVPCEVADCASVAYPFFASQADLDRALLLLSTSSWDAPDKAALFSARIELTELAGFAEVAAAARVIATQERTTPTEKVGPDELDSYEALVRDAGKFYNAEDWHEKQQHYFHTSCFSY